MIKHYTNRHFTCFLSPNQQYQSIEWNLNQREKLPARTKLSGSTAELQVKEHRHIDVITLVVQYQYQKNYYYYICLTAFFQDNLGKPAPER